MRPYPNTSTRSRPRLLLQVAVQRRAVNPQHSRDLHDWLSAGAHRFRRRDLLRACSLDDLKPIARC
jgi:hypothetical protein